MRLNSALKDASAHYWINEADWNYEAISRWKFNLCVFILFVFEKETCKKKTCFIIANVFNPFVPNVPFLYPVKTSENFTIFYIFRG